MTIKIFISYARKDEAAKDIIELLNAKVEALAQIKDSMWENATVWWDKQIPAGKAWWGNILDKIQGCTHFVYLLSEASLDSPYCRAEHQWARDVSRRMFYIKTHNFRDIRVPKDINRIQIIPAYDENKELGVNKLLEDIANVPDDPTRPKNISTMARPKSPSTPLDDIAEKINQFNEEQDGESIIYQLWRFIRDDKYRDDAIYLANYVMNKFTKKQYYDDIQAILQEAQSLQPNNAPAQIVSTPSKSTIDDELSFERKAFETRVKKSYPKSLDRFMDIWYEFKDYLDDYDEDDIEDIAHQFEIPISTSTELATELVRNSNFLIDFLLYTNQSNPELSERLYNIYTSTNQILTD